jgi:hypothetical protein
LKTEYRRSLASDSLQATIFAVDKPKRKSYQPAAWVEVIHCLAITVFASFVAMWIKVRFLNRPAGNVLRFGMMSAEPGSSNVVFWRTKFIPLPPVPLHEAHSAIGFTLERWTSGPYLNEQLRTPFWFLIGLPGIIIFSYELFAYRRRRNWREQYGSPSRLDRVVNRINVFAAK